MESVISDANFYFLWNIMMSMFCLGVLTTLAVQALWGIRPKQLSHKNEKAVKLPPFRR